MRKDICIYVSSPYSYKDIFDVYYQAYQKFASRSSIPLVLSTNYDAKYEGIRIISSGDINDSWVSRSMDALKQIDSKYILLMCDDIFMAGDFPDDEINHILKFMDKNNINFCRLSPRKKGVKIKGERYLVQEYKTVPYAMNLQFGIYNREYLLGVLGDGMLSAWDIEAKWLKESNLAEYVLWENVICVSEPIVKFIHGVDKGKLYPSAVQEIKRLGFLINSSREVMSWFREYQQYFRNFVGLVVPSRLRSHLKVVLTKIGFKFTSEF